MNEWRNEGMNDQLKGGKNDREKCVHVAHKYLQFLQDKDEWMNEWLNEWMNEWMNKRLNE